jgi:hypothetical protein
VRYGPALSILGSRVSCIELRHKGLQLCAAHAAVQRIHGRSRQQISLGAVSVEIDSADVCAERRSARIRERESELELPGQLRHPSQIQDVREIGWERTGVLQPIVEIESVYAIRALRGGSLLHRRLQRLEHRLREEAGAPPGHSTVLLMQRLKEIHERIPPELRSEHPSESTIQEVRARLKAIFDSRKQTAPLI